MVVVTKTVSAVRHERGRKRRLAGENGSAVSPALGLQIEFLKLATLITRPMRDIVAAPNGLSIDDIKIMLCLGDRGALTGREISDLVALSTMAASRSIAHLDEMGWLTRYAEEHDKRRRPVALSEAGLNAYRSIMPSIGTVADQVFGGFSQLELIALASALERMEHSLAEMGSRSASGENETGQER
jgi:DNA-binding MarR family transcriptional regulator